MVLFAVYTFGFVGVFILANAAGKLVVYVCSEKNS